MTRDRVKAGCGADHSSRPSCVAKIDGDGGFVLIGKRPPALQSMIPNRETRRKQMRGSYRCWW